MNDLRAVACIFSALLLSYATAGGGPPPVDTLEADMRKQHEKRLDAITGVTPEIKSGLLARFDAALKLRMTIDQITVYRNATAYRCTLVSRLDGDVRLSYAGYAFKIGDFADSNGQTWGVPPWDGHVYVGKLYYEQMFLVPKSKATRVVFVDEVKPPNFARLKPPPAGNKVDVPTKLSYDWYQWAGFETDDPTKATRGLVLARGTTPVEWKDGDKPPDLKSRVIDSKPIPKD